MEAETQAKIDEIWAIIRAGTIRSNEIERRCKESYDRAMARMDRLEAKQAESEARWERKMEALRKVVLTGMQMMVKLQEADKEIKAELRALAAESRALRAEQRAFLNSLRNRNGRNGHRR